MKKSIKTVALSCMVVLLAAVTACNTVRGIGEDVEAGGEAIQRTAS